MKQSLMIIFLSLIVLLPRSFAATLSSSTPTTLAQQLPHQQPNDTMGTPLSIDPQRQAWPGYLPSVFGYPGKTCPAETTPYKGPETQVALESGAILCVFKRRVVARPKAFGNGHCGGKEYVDPKYKPDADTIWCEPPLDPK